MVHWRLPKVPGGPAARGGCACTTLGSQVVFFGGADRMTKAYDDVWVLETANGAYSWQQKPTTCDEGLSVYPRSGSTLTAVGGRVYLYGGQDIASGMCHGDILCLDTASWHWSRVQIAGGSQPPPRHSHCTGKLADNCLLVFGGVGENGQMNDVWIFNTEQRGWSCPEIKSDKPCAREMHSGTMVDATTMLVYGGRSSSGRVLDDVAVLDAKAMRWRCMEPTPFARCAHSGCVMPRLDVLAPREQEQGQGQQEPEPMDTSEEGGGAGGAAAEAVVLIYGGFSGESVEGDAFYIDPNSTEIEIVKRGPRQSDAASGAQLPAPRFAHNAAAVPSSNPAFSVEMVVFGGVNPNEDLKDVAVLRCGEEPAGEAGVVHALGQGVTVEEVGSMGHELEALTTTIQHKEGLVELKISEAPPRPQ